MRTEGATRVGAAVLASSLACTAVLLAASYTPAGPWAGAKAAFSNHPGGMALAFTLLMPLSMAAYAADSPLLRKRLGDRHARRRIHGALNGAGAVCAGVAWYTAWAVHEAKGESHFASGKAWVKQAHVWAGYAALALTALQCGVGAYKYVARVRRGARAAAWHGRLGILTWALGMAAVATAAWFSLVGRGLVVVGGAALVLAAALGASVYVQMYIAPRPPISGDSAPLAAVVRPAAGSAPTAGREEARGAGGAAVAPVVLGDGSVSPECVAAFAAADEEGDEGGGSSDDSDGGGGGGGDGIRRSGGGGDAISKPLASDGSGVSSGGAGRRPR